MKKKLLIIGSSILLLSGLVAGVFAKYQTTIDNVASGTVTAKQFIFNAKTLTSDTGVINISLAPGEQYSISMNIQNYSSKNAYDASEVDIEVEAFVTLTSNDPSDGFDATTINSPLSYTLSSYNSKTYKTTVLDESIKYLNKKNGTTKKEHNSVTLNGGAAQLLPVDFTIKFDKDMNTDGSNHVDEDGNGYSNQYIGKSANYSIKFVGTQK